ncbi:unnamed protein product [Cuscuta campestris]|uniref:SKP1 component dimerisation domain-containing protein n=1 Tax=Cuscuta campestris TaxID=132261 RepID=A0A484LFD5_9ASTE|nr:unnamed protein product [Cuscuta campestris]
MKSYVWIQTSDGLTQPVEQVVAMFCPFICHEMHSGLGSSKNCPILLPSTVNPAMLSLIIDYCHFHQVHGRSNKERKSFDEKFIRIDIKRLCQLTSAADSLQLKPLLDLTSRALARMIEGKNPEEIRNVFHLPDDLTEEEKLEPLKNTMDDPRIRLLNRLYARKRKELKGREILKNPEVEEDQADERSVDDLMSFINGEDGDSKGVRASKSSKRKNRKRKDQNKNTPTKQELKMTSVDCTATVNDHSGHKADRAFNMAPFESNCFVPEQDSDDGLDDEIDPAMKEKIDREVADFARILNSDWPERMQEILSLGQERSRVPITINGTS